MFRVFEAFHVSVMLVDDFSLNLYSDEEIKGYALQTQNLATGSDCEDNPLVPL